MYVREGRRLPQIVRRHFGKISGVAAVALAGAAIAAPEASAVNVPPPGGVTSNQCIGETFGRSDVKQTCVVDLQGPGDQPRLRTPHRGRHLRTAYGGGR